MRAAIYCRISQDHTGERAGVTRQREDCEKLAGERGYEVVGVHEDNSTSAYNGKERPAWAAMWRDVEAGDVDVIVAWHPDRLYRRMRDLVEVTDLVQKHGVRVETVTAGDVDLSTPEGVMQAQIVGAVAEKESADKRRRSSRWHEQRAAQGRPPGGGTRAFGYDRHREDGQTVWTIRPDEADTFRNIVKRLLAGESLSAICNHLNDEGLTTSTGSRWSLPTLKKMLKSPTRAGFRRTKGDELVEGSWLAIIDRQTYEDVLATMESRKMKGQRDSTEYPLTGVLRCGNCGELMTGHRKQSGRRYECRGSADGRRFTGCGSVSSVAQPVEDFMRKVIVEGLDDEALARMQRESDGTDRERSALVEGIKRLESELEALADDYAEGSLSRSAYTKASTRMEQRLEQARKSYRSSAGNDVLATIEGGDVARAWDNGSASWRRALVDALFVRVELHPAKWRGGQFDASRIKRVWRV